MTNAGAWVYYKLTCEPLAHVSKKSKITPDVPQNDSEIAQMIMSGSPFVINWISLPYHSFHRKPWQLLCLQTPPVYWTVGQL